VVPAKGPFSKWATLVFAARLFPRVLAKITNRSWHSQALMELDILKSSMYPFEGFQAPASRSTLPTERATAMSLEFRIELLKSGLSTQDVMPWAMRPVMRGGCQTFIMEEPPSEMQPEIFAHRKATNHNREIRWC
jgi:hypothetical protein